MGSPFRIIQPVHADDERATLHALFEPFGDFALRRALGLARKGARVDANWRRDGRHGMTVDERRHARLDRHIQNIAHAIFEVVQMPLGLKADDIIGAEHMHQFVRARQDGEQACRHEGDVKKEADTIVDAKRAQRHGERDQMIVVNPDEIARLDQRRERARISPVDVQIRIEMGAVEFDEARLEMQQRP